MIHLQESIIKNSGQINIAVYIMLKVKIQNAKCKMYLSVIDF